MARRFLLAALDRVLQVLQVCIFRLAVFRFFSP